MSYCCRAPLAYITVELHSWLSLMPLIPLMVQERPFPLCVKIDPNLQRGLNGYLKKKSQMSPQL